MTKRKPMRPQGLSDFEVFEWFMPGDPPPSDTCWDWPLSTCKGYGQFGRNVNNKHYTILVHQVSYRKFHGPIPDGALVLHSCDRRICAQPAHLSLGTHAENTAQAKRRGRLAIGVRAGHAKLTDSDVMWIRSSGLSNIYMAKVLHVSDGTICNARQGKSWSHIPMPENAR